MRNVTSTDVTKILEIGCHRSDKFSTQRRMVWLVPLKERKALAAKVKAKLKAKGLTFDRLFTKAKDDQGWLVIMVPEVNNRPGKTPGTNKIVFEVLCKQRNDGSWRAFLDTTGGERAWCRGDSKDEAITNMREMLMALVEDSLIKLDEEG